MVHLRRSDCYSGRKVSLAMLLVQVLHLWLFGRDALGALDHGPEVCISISFEIVRLIINAAEYTRYTIASVVSCTSCLDSRSSILRPKCQPITSYLVLPFPSPMAAMT